MAKKPAAKKRKVLAFEVSKEDYEVLQKLKEAKSAGSDICIREEGGLIEVVDI